MAHVYRSVWVDNSLNALFVAPDAVRTWLRERGTVVDFARNRSVSAGGRTVTWVEEECEAFRGLQISVREPVADAEGEWTTTLTVLNTAEDNVVWVDMDSAVDGIWQRPIYAPRLVRGLLLAGGAPMVGDDDLEVQPRDVDSGVGVTHLAEGLLNRGRQLPYLVVVGGIDDLRPLGVQRATAAAEVLAGLVRVYVVEAGVAGELNEVLFPDRPLGPLDAFLAMPGWTQGSYDPGRGMSIADEDLGDETRALGLVVSRRLGTLGAWVAPRPEWTEMKRRLTEARRSLPRSDGAAPEVDVTAEMRRTGHADEHGQLLTALIALDELSAQVEEQRARADRFREQLVARLVAAPVVFRPKLTLAETVEEVRKNSRHISIPDTAPQRFDELDTLEMSRVWARDLASLFISLESYAAAKAAGSFRGDYHRWLVDEGDYPAGKVSPDSESTKRDPVLRRTRTFAVPPALDASGWKVMSTHAKIQAKGGGQIPRVYFHDDTSGVTKKIHVGFIGPHYLVPTSTF